MKRVDGKGLFLICLDKDRAEILEILNKMSVHRGIQLKEPSYLEDALTQRKYSDGKAETELWWDVENHWMACLGKDKAKLLLKGLEALRDRWKAEGKI